MDAPEWTSILTSTKILLWISNSAMMDSVKEKLFTMGKSTARRVVSASSATLAISALVGTGVCYFFTGALDIFEVWHICLFPSWAPGVEGAINSTHNRRCAGEGRGRVHETKGIRSQKALRGNGSRLIEVGCAMRPGP